MAEDRLDWAARRLRAIEDAYERHGLPTRFQGGARFSYRGREFPLTVIVTSEVVRSRVELTDERLIVSIGPAPDGEQPELVRTALLRWYKQAARGRLEAAVEAWSPVVDVSPGSVSVRNQRRRWGSCSRSGNLNFNWRLIMAPAEVLDYVVVHELCHLREPNHSSRYWALVARAMPEHALRRRWLKENAVLLDACV